MDAFIGYYYHCPYGIEKRKNVGIKRCKNQFTSLDDCRAYVWYVNAFPGAALRSYALCALFSCLWQKRQRSGNCNAKDAAAIVGIDSNRAFSAFASHFCCWLKECVVDFLFLTNLLHFVGNRSMRLLEIRIIKIINVLLMNLHFPSSNVWVVSQCRKFYDVLPHVAKLETFLAQLYSI